MTVGHVEPAYAKVNLCLFLGGARPDGRHELVTLFESVQLRDELHLTESVTGRDEVICPGVAGPNLVSGALAGLRAAGWSAPPVRVEIEKRIPVAAGMGGGSADAAAMLRLAPRLAPVALSTVTRIAVGLGADVPGQLDPGPSVGTGAGDVVEAVADLGTHSLLVLPQPFGLSTAEVYREADRLGLGRPGEELASLRARLERAVGGADGGSPIPEPLMVNDLQPAALAQRPEIGRALQRAGEVGADRALVCGSGPTVIGVFWGARAASRAQQAAETLRHESPGAIAVRGGRQRGPLVDAERVSVSRYLRQC